MEKLLRALGKHVVLTLGLLLLTVQAAMSHAVPESGVPPIDGVVAVAPDMPQVVFSEEIVPDGTALEVYALTGARVDNGNSAADLNDSERRRVSVGLIAELEPGGYLVQWTSHSAIDGDEVSGSYQFRFDPDATPAPAAATAVTESGTPASTPAATEAVDEQDDDESSLMTALLIGLAAVLATCALGFAVWKIQTRRRSKTGVEGP